MDRARLAHPAEPRPDGPCEIAAPPPEAVAPVDALAGCMARVLGELSADDAAVLRTCDLQGQDQRDFAHAQGLSLAAVESRLLRARQRLRAQQATACQVRFDADGAVDGHVPRSEAPG